MADHPIIFSAPMVSALLEGRKTMTRRLAWSFFDVNDNHTKKPTPWQRVRVGDRLWVREALVYETGMWWYAADRARVGLSPPHIAAGIAWAHHYSRDKAPSIHMPRACSRLTLNVTATKIERLQMIRRSEIVAEGVESGIPVEFTLLWDSLHGQGAWDGNPEVVALTFMVHKQNIDALAKVAA